jgi:hypothetical protein
MEGTYQTVLITIVLPVAGLGLVFGALIWGKRLPQRYQELSIKKIGIELKLGTMTFMVLLGFAVASVPVYVTLSDYQTRIDSLKKQAGDRAAEIATMERVLDGFKDYAMRIHLCFPETDTVDMEQVEVQAYVSKGGTAPPELSASETTVGFADDLWVSVCNLNPGDQLRLVAHEGDDRFWQSIGVLEIPNAELNMRRVTP